MGGAARYLRLLLAVSIKEGGGKLRSTKALEVVDALANADEVHRQRPIAAGVGECDQGAAFGRAVEFGHDQAR